MENNRVTLDVHDVVIEANESFEEKLFWYLCKVYRYTIKNTIVVDEQIKEDEIKEEVVKTETIDLKTIFPPDKEASISFSAAYEEIPEWQEFEDLLDKDQALRVIEEKLPEVVTDEILEKHREISAELAKVNEKFRERIETGVYAIVCTKEPLPEGLYEKELVTPEDFEEVYREHPTLKNRLKNQP